MEGDRGFYDYSPFDYEEPGNGDPPEGRISKQYSCLETGLFGVDCFNFECDTPTHLANPPSSHLASQTTLNDAEGVFRSPTWSQSPSGVAEVPDWALANYYQGDTDGVEMAPSLSQPQRISYPPPTESELVGDEPLGSPQLDFERLTTMEMPLFNMSPYVT